jgi:hypothetical protein
MARVDLLNISGAASNAAAQVSSDTQGSAGGTAGLAWSVALTFDVTALAGTAPTIQLLLEAFDPLSGKFVQWGTAFAAISAVSTAVYLVALGVAAPSGGITATLSLPIPGMWRVRTVAGGTITSASFTCSAQIMPNY